MFDVERFIPGKLNELKVRKTVSVEGHQEVCSFGELK
jgi:hypothetical protein